MNTRSIIALISIVFIFFLGVSVYGARILQGFKRENFDREAIEKCIPGAKEMKFSDNAINSNILLYKKTIEIGKTIKDPDLRSDSVTKWINSDYSPYIDSFPVEQKNEVYKLMKLIRIDDKYTDCLIQKLNQS